MGFFRQLYDNIGYLTSKDWEMSSKLLNKPPSNLNDVSITQIGNENGPPEAIFPQWFFSAPLGQPRRINVNDIRQFAKSPWVQMVLGTIKREITTIPWDLVPADENDETDYTEKKKIAREFFNNVNPDNQAIEDIFSETVTDVGEIDAGVWNLVYSADSYDIGEVPVLDAYGREIGSHEGLILRPLGQRTLRHVKTVDGASVLKQVDIHKNLQKYYQYSFKHPRQNPTPFVKEEMVYLHMNKKSYSIYGFSPVQIVQQVLEVLIQGTRYNKDLFYNNAVPDILASLPKLPSEQLEKLKRMWDNRYKGKPHQIGFINWPVENFHKLAETNRDLEWLNGQKWYFRIVFGAFGVSPTEAGFFENSSKSNDEGQYRVTVRNAIKPYLEMFARFATSRLLTEIFQDENHGLKFKFLPKDSEEEKVAFEQSMKELEMGSLTINEYRKKLGRDDVDWGDEPVKQSFGGGGGGFGFDEENDPNNPKPDKIRDSYKKSFEGFMHGRYTKQHTTGQ